MSSTDLGNSNINYSYNHSFTSQYHGERQNFINKPGIYQGGELTYDSTHLYINPFICEYRCSAGNNVRVKTTSIITNDLTAAITESNPVVPTESTPFVCSYFTWVNSSITYTNYIARSEINILTNDVIFGKCLFTSGVITGIDYSQKTWGLVNDQGDIRGNSLYIRTLDTPTEISESGLIITGTTNGSSIQAAVDGTTNYIPYADNTTDANLATSYASIKQFARIQAIIF